MRFTFGLVLAIAATSVAHASRHPAPATATTAAQGLRMPRLRGLTIDSAVRVLGNQKLPRPRVKRSPSPIPAGRVIDQSPEAGLPVDFEKGIDLTVSTGAPPPPETTVDSVTVPNLIGETRASLIARVLISKLEIVDAGSIPDDANAGKVVRQDPGEGARIPRTTPINLWFGRGTPKPVRVTVPDLRDSTVEAADVTLRRAGLRLGGVERLPATNGNGRIARQLPPAHDSVPPRTAVDVVILVAAPVPVPKVVGMPIGRAVDVLNRAGLSASPVDSVESDSTARTVVVQRPEPGTPVVRGSSVYLQIAVPSKFVTVPSLIRLTPERAGRVLDSAGLRLGAVNPRRREDGDGLITSQGPVATSRVVRGTPVAVWVAVPFAPDTVPSVKDSSVNGAAQVIEAAGLIVGTVTYRTRATGDSAVAEQRPAAGALAPHGSAVDLVVLIPQVKPPPPPPPPPGPLVPPAPLVPLVPPGLVTVPNVVEQPIATAIETLQGLRLRPQQFDSASGVSGETGFVLRQEPVAGSAIPGDSVVRLWVGIASSSSLWLIILGSLAGLVAAAATVKTVRQRLRDKEWRRRLTFEKHSVPGAPRIPASANPLARPEMQLVPRPGAVQSSVVGDGPLIKGDSK